MNYQEMHQAIWAEIEGLRQEVFQALEQLRPKRERLEELEAIEPRLAKLSGIKPRVTDVRMLDILESPSSSAHPTPIAPVWATVQPTATATASPPATGRGLTSPAESIDYHPEESRADVIEKILVKIGRPSKIGPMVAEMTAMGHGQHLTRTALFNGTFSALSRSRRFQKVGKGLWWFANDYQPGADGEEGATTRSLFQYEPSQS